MSPLFDFYCALLIFAGATVLLVSLVAGIPYGNAITNHASEEKVRAWRLAHSSLAMGGATTLAVAAVLPWLHGTGWERALVAWCFVLSGAAFCIALPYAAMTGQRGLIARGPMQNWVVYGGNVVGALTSLVGTVVLLYTAIRNF